MALEAVVELAEEAVEMCGDGRITEAGTLAAVLLTARCTSSAAPATVIGGANHRVADGS
ncbi:hypothetical protein ACIA8O_36065 [Kitasatospora sp. NPDC051853]|uniref:hypothetical protein n=1 Tax=Kitasatospora sp. NPDC051853 TaxID=3364058 RepID=UPI0037B22234